MNEADGKLCVASAPGKAFLIGEYAVLEGAEAIVTAVDVRAHAYDARPRFDEVAERNPFVDAASSAALPGAAEAPTADGETPFVSTVGFAAGGRKLGLGSSAAVVASLVGRRWLNGGAELDDAARRALYPVARAAHTRAQDGRGSGADVAASVLGGTLAFRDGEARSLAWPAGLHVCFFDAGAPASTTAFLDGVRAGAERAPEDYARTMETLRDAAETFQRAFVRDTVDFDALRGAVEAHVLGLRALQALSGAPICTESIDRIVATASEMGLAAKPSGAGGGDMVVAFAPSEAALDQLAVLLRERWGLARLSDVKAHAEGLRAESRPPLCARVPGVFRGDVAERRKRFAASRGGDLAREAGFAPVDPGALDLEAAGHMIENVVGVLALPLGVATNFRINGRDVLVPMAVEEASVVAAASNAAKLVRAGGGFVADADPPWMIAQVQLVGEGDAQAALAAATANPEDLLAVADAQHPRLVARGGGARCVEGRILDAHNVVVHLLVDCRDAMGANLLNTVAEAVAPVLEARTGWRAHLRILSNLADRRTAHVRARVPFDALRTEALAGADVAASVVEASRFAELDPYRAATHNKGIMNGVDAVVLATGNDWRAMEAAAHAFAARRGHYAPLATWSLVDDALVGAIRIPVPLGVVGGATRAHPSARWSMDLLENPSATRLGQIVAAAGLASNLAALRALATEGIQRGHMALHARAVALAAGARGSEVEKLAKALIDVGEIKPERAAAFLREMRASEPGDPVPG